MVRSQGSRGLRGPGKGHVSRYVSFWVGFGCGLGRFRGRREGRCVRVWSLRSVFRFSARWFSVPDCVFFAIFGSFWGGTPLRDHLFRPKGAGEPPGRARDRFWKIFGGFRAPFWGSGEVVFRTSRQLFFGVFWGRLRGHFSEDFGSILGGFSVPFGCLFGESRIL